MQLRTIIRKEILEYLKSAKFLLSLLVTTALVTLTTLINIDAFTHRQEDYLRAKQEMRIDPFYVRLYRPPQVLSILHEGKERTLGNSLEMTYLKIPFRTSGYMGDESAQYRFLAGFSSVDFSFVVKVILSLMIIFLAYGSISEEKQRGTLRLMLANQVPRDRLLLGKCIGGLIVILGSLVVSMNAALLIMLSSSHVSLNGADWLRLFGLLVFSSLYLIVFYMVTILVSVIAKRPSIALMILLQLWTLLVIIYPILGITLAEKTYPLPTPKEISQNKIAAFQSYIDEYQRNYDAFIKAAKAGGQVSKDVGIRFIELAALKAELEHKIDMDFDTRLTQQLRLAHRFSILSPVTLFDIAAERLCCTGIPEYERFMDGVIRYWRLHVERSKLLFSDIAAYNKTKMPDFPSSPEPLADSFAAAIPQGLFLFFMSLGFFSLAHVAFIRKDVR